MGKTIELGFSTDNRFLHELVLNKWLVNVYPVEPLNTAAIVVASKVWNAIGLSKNKYLSSALISP
jgi:hypothetical protein